jgi:hypothetical protein
MKKDIFGLFLLLAVTFYSVEAVEEFSQLEK